MADVIFIIVTVVFFIIACLYVRAAIVFKEASWLWNILLD